MTTKRFPFYRDIINLILIYLLIIGSFMVICSGIRIAILPAEYLSVGGILILVYLFRRCVKHFLVYMILHAAMLAASFLPPMDAPGKIRVVVMAVVVTLLDIHYWYGEERPVPSIHPAVCLAFLLIILITGKLDFGYATPVYYMGVSFVILVLIRMIIENFYDLSGSGQLTEQMPVWEIFRNNTFFAGMIVLIAAAFMLFVKADRLINAINRLIYTFWTWVENFIREVFGKQQPDQATANTITGANDLIRELEQLEESDSLIMAMLRILEAALILFVLIVVAYVLIKAVLTVVQALMGKRRIRGAKYQSYKIKNEVRVRLSKSEEGQKRGGLFRTPVEKVRQIYKKELLRYQKNGAAIRRTKTPSENRDLVLEKSGKDIMPATKIYERVRYGVPETATAADVSELRGIFKRLQR